MNTENSVTAPQQYQTSYFESNGKVLGKIDTPNPTTQPAPAEQTTVPGFGLPSSAYKLSKSTQDRLNAQQGIIPAAPKLENPYSSYDKPKPVYTTAAEKRRAEVQQAMEDLPGHFSIESLQQRAIKSRNDDAIADYEADKKLAKEVQEEQEAERKRREEKADNDMIDKSLTDYIAKSEKADRMYPDFSAADMVDIYKRHQRNKKAAALADLGAGIGAALGGWQNTARNYANASVQADNDINTALGMPDRHLANQGRILDARSKFYTIRANRRSAEINSKLKARELDIKETQALSEIELQASQTAYWRAKAENLPEELAIKRAREEGYAAYRRAKLGIEQQKADTQKYRATHSGSGGGGYYGGNGNVIGA